MKTLVTGGSGFIGSHLLRLLKATGTGGQLYNLGRHDPEIAGVTHLACNLTDEEATAAALTRIKPDRLFHFAGASRVGGVGMPEYFQKNTLTTAYLIRALEAAGRPIKIFFASSVHVYGNQPGEVDESAPPRPTSGHGFSKFLAEEGLRNFASRNSLAEAVVVGRLYNCIGPGQGEGFVASDLCHRLVRLSGKAPLRTGPLSPLRRFVDVRDAVRILPPLLEAPQPSRFEIYNVASPHELEIRELLGILLHVSGKHPAVETDESLAGNPFNGLHLSTRKLERTIPLRPFRPIEETLREMYEAATMRVP